MANMKSKGWIIIGIIATIAILWFFVLQPRKAFDSSIYTSTNACDYLTQDVANQALGQGAQKGEPAAPAGSDDVTVSLCTYTESAHTLGEIKNMQSATLL